MKKVVLLIPQSREYERGLLNGIARYSRIHGPWATYMRLPDYQAGHPSIMNHLKQLCPDGFIVRVPFFGKIEQILSFNKPVIVTDIKKPVPDLHSIEPDCKLPAQLATDYFWAKGHTRFGFVGFAKSYWCKQRGYYLEQAVAARNQSLSQHYCILEQDYLLEIEQKKLIRWLVGLPKPIAIMTTNCDMARHVLEACRIACISVPEEVSVLGIDNDPLICGLSIPTLSSIAYNFEKTGYEAARILDQLMAGTRLPIQKIMMQPTHIITRESTDRSFIDDSDISKALTFIREHSKTIVQVDDVADAVGVSRRLLERKFHTLLDRSIYSEIIRVRMNRAAQMLSETTLPINKIAAEFGYSEERYFTRCFKSVMKMSPSNYRKRFVNTA